MPQWLLPYATMLQVLCRRVSSDGARRPRRRSGRRQPSSGGINYSSCSGAVEGPEKAWPSRTSVSASILGRVRRVDELSRRVMIGLVEAKE